MICSFLTESKRNSVNRFMDKSMNRRRERVGHKLLILFSGGQVTVMVQYNSVTRGG